MAFDVALERQCGASQEGFWRVIEEHRDVHIAGLRVLATSHAAKKVHRRGAVRVGLKDVGQQPAGSVATMQDDGMAGVGDLSVESLGFRGEWRP